MPDWSEITCRFPPKSPAAFDRNQVPVCSDFCKPSQGAFDDPATGKHRKARDIGAPPDDLDRPVAELGERAVEPAAAVGAVGKQMAQPGKQVVDGADDQRGTIAILHIGGVDFRADQQAQRVGDM